MGAKAAGMGYASSCLTDEWSLFNNIAGLAHVKNSLLCTAYDAKPQLEGANRMAFIACLPTRLGTSAVGVFRFGDDLYSEQKVSVGFSNQLGLASLGASLNYLQYNALGFGTKGMITLTIGGIAELTEKLSIGAHIQHVNQPTLSDHTGERLPTFLTLGIGLKPSEKILLISEIQKDLESGPTYKSGIDYRPSKKFTLRTGFNLHPNKFFFGIGFNSTRLLIDYAYEHALEGVGSSHQASAGYRLRKK